MFASFRGLLFVSEIGMFVGGFIVTVMFGMSVPVWSVKKTESDAFSASVA